MKKLFLILFLISFAASYAAEDKKPIKLGTKLKNEEIQKTTDTFIPVDNSTKFKIDPKEITEIDSMDAKALQEKVDSIRNKVFDAKSKLIETTKNEIAANIPLSYLVIEHKNTVMTFLELKKISILCLMILWRRDIMRFL
ncbi:MAG: hypothetical protein NTY22_07245 [Proteobacteria bacterium]|nr:hypothetical protein [Pseudomonadota bacterium]